MKQKILLCACALLITMMVFSETKVAVYVTGANNLSEATKQIIGSELVAGLVTNNEYVAVERTAEFLQELQKEQALNPNISIDDQQIRAIGRQMGVALVCVANVMPWQDAYYIQARMLNVSSATIEATARETSTLASLDEIVSASEKLTTKLMAQIQAKQEEKSRAAEIEAQRQRELQEEQARQRAIEEENARQQEALRRQQQMAEQARHQEQIQESIESIGNAIQQIVASSNSYIVEIYNTTKNPYRVNLDGHILGVVSAYKVQRYQVPLEWYGRMQAVQTSGYFLSPTIKEYRIPRQQRQAKVSVRIQ